MWPIATDAEWSWLWAVLKWIKTNHDAVWGVDTSGSKEASPGGGQDPIEESGNLTEGILWPTVKYWEYQTWAKVIWEVAAVMWPFAVSTAATCLLLQLYHSRLRSFTSLPKNEFLELWEFNRPSTIYISEFWHCSRPTETRGVNVDNTAGLDQAYCWLCRHDSCVQIWHCGIFRYWRIFCNFHKVHILHFFPNKLAFLMAILILFVFLLPRPVGLLGFVTSTTWLPTERHQSCVRTPVERDGYHISTTY